MIEMLISKIPRT